MKFTRRETIVLGLATSAAALLPAWAFAAQEEIPMVGTMDEFLNGAEAGTGGITLNAPEIAENGNTVPIDVSADGAAEIRVYALGNPEPPVAAFTFGPLAASQAAATRIRLAKTQDIVAIAKMPDGTFVKDQKTVKVTIGGCGG